MQYFTGNPPYSDRSYSCPGSPAGRTRAGIRRPVVVVSVDILNNGPGGLVVVVPITTANYGLRSHVELASSTRNALQRPKLRRPRIAPAANRRADPRCGHPTWYLARVVGGVEWLPDGLVAVATQSLQAGQTGDASARAAQEDSGACRDDRADGDCCVVRTESRITGRRGLRAARSRRPRLERRNRGSETECRVRLPVRQAGAFRVAIPRRT
ncbi:type II toxin-antitoxin system PemK/MazF family toxin [Mycolicibacterium alvei]|uniref:type II toxin-antitoxin system PemK/MazF family toxin n=1 Tax=Mycolicibacterium alvei TaxID=67081 RepID=UPI001F46FFD7|nr:type II toxin-antitoxin system PemK/MazF family toxin [Mycolicibacterium alvei]